MTTEEQNLRTALIKQCLFMNSSGLSAGTSGNMSVRYQNQMIITPSGIPYEQLEPDMLASMLLDGEGEWQGPLKPSSEWRFHLDLMRGRDDVGAIVHAHPPYCTSLAITRREIPAVHYMIAAFGGNTIRCADYARFGTAELSGHVLKAMQGRNGCLMANHGMLVAGSSLEKAMWLAIELETLAQQYFNTLLIGEATVLDDAAIAEALQAFSGYGLQD
ncbi:MAG: class II aldolase/adducin family protein [Thiolinea sp.]